jgi:hypothetical protein
MERIVERGVNVPGPVECMGTAMPRPYLGELTTGCEY